MARNLIDDSSLEFIEGMERGERIEVGQTVEIVPFSIANDTTIGPTIIEDERIYLANLEHPIYTTDYSHIIFELNIIGLKINGSTSADAVACTPRIVGEDENGNAIVKIFGSIKPVNNVEGTYFPSRCDIHFVAEATGQYHKYLIGYQNGSFKTENGKNTSTDVLPYKITKVGLLFDNAYSYEVQTNGIIATIKGVKV